VVDSSGLQPESGGYITPDSEKLWHSFRKGTAVITWDEATLEGLNKQQLVGYIINQQLVNLFELPETQKSLGYTTQQELEVAFREYNIRLEVFFAKSYRFLTHRVSF
jgi:hypothetical protein